MLFQAGMFVSVSLSLGVGLWSGCIGGQRSTEGKVLILK